MTMGTPATLSGSVGPPVALGPSCGCGADYFTPSFAVLIARRREPTQASAHLSQSCIPRESFLAPIRNSPSRIASGYDDPSWKALVGAVR